MRTEFLDRSVAIVILPPDDIVMGRAATRDVALDHAKKFADFLGIKILEIQKA